MADVEIRPARPEEWAEVGGLRWDSVADLGGVAVDPREVFAAAFARWAGEHADGHECIVAVAGDRVVGMMWLAIVPRVPSAKSFDRASGDLQCAYVVPELRNRGIGGRLMEAVLARARDLGLERVTVHSSPRAVPAYERHGFAPEDRLLHTYLSARPGRRA
ncbi:GNAT family N-acetyltransferase [Leifsonia sp. SIMBA_070]|uniref:GNAT family N-acetyltransferase n=1 Tax=Leifsonia sp. SIMBA_070 TaxID=3085810 RepID=UPI0039799AED